MKQELLDLFDELKLLNSQDDFGISDLSISENDDLDEHEYISFYENIIHYNDGFYDISCVDDIHPTIKFSSKEEVIAFFIGYNKEEFGGFKMWVYSNNMDKEEHAYNIGYYCRSIAYIRVLENVILPKYLHEKQYKYQEI